MKKFITIFVLITLLFSSCNWNLEIIPWECGCDVLDERDNETYETVLIDGTCWMKNNLRFGNPVSSTDQIVENDNMVQVVCRNYEFSECELLGAYYTWDEVIEASQTCPDGWKIPNKVDFEELIYYLRGPANVNPRLSLTEALNVQLNGAFNPDSLLAIPNQCNDGDFDNFRCSAFFWTSSTYENDSRQAYFTFIGDGAVFDTVMINIALKKVGMNLRCIMEN